MKKNKQRQKVHKKSKDSQKLKGRKKVVMPEIANSDGLFLGKIPNPFADLDSDARHQAIHEFAQNSEKQYNETLANIKKLLQRYDPVMLLSIIASYGLTVGVGDNGVQFEDSDAKIHQAHVELCQSLALQIRPEELQRQAVGPDVVQNMWDLLDVLMRTHNFRNINWMNDDATQNEKAISLLQLSIKGNTQLVRNWGYFSQVLTISTEIYAYFDKPMNEKFGFTANDVIYLFSLLITEIEEAATTRLYRLSSLRKIKNKTQLVFKYYEMIGLSSKDADMFLRAIDVQSIPYNSLFFMLISHYDLWIEENYTFSPEVLALKLGEDELKIKQILDEFSFKWGELETYETESLYYSNPIWLRPIIKLDDNEYFCVLPQVFFSKIFPALDRLVEEIDRHTLSNRKAQYLERKVVDIINRRFPESNTISGVKWKLEGVEYETDLITFIDSHAVIVEAKSGKITDPALRGAPARLKKHVEDILVAPNIQSKRLQHKLEELISDTDAYDPLRDKLPLDLKRIHKIIRVSVSLEDFGSIQSNVNQLRETGWLPLDFEPCPTMTIADFETLFDFLDHPVQIIHYLERRQELENELAYIGDELDLMGLYIETLFNIGDINTNDFFVITGMSSPLDKYYISRDVGVVIPKPRPKISPLFSGILTQLENRKTPRWTEIGVMLSRFSPVEQLQLTKMIEKLKKSVRQKWMVEGHTNTAVVVPPKNSKFALCYVLYNDYNADKRNIFIQNAGVLGLEPEHVEQCLVIAKNIDRDDLNYHFIGLMA